MTATLILALFLNAKAWCDGGTWCWEKLCAGCAVTSDPIFEEIRPVIHFSGEPAQNLARGTWTPITLPTIVDAGMPIMVSQ